MRASQRNLVASKRGLRANKRGLRAIQKGLRANQRACRGDVCSDGWMDIENFTLFYRTLSLVEAAA